MDGVEGKPKIEPTVSLSVKDENITKKEDVGIKLELKPEYDVDSQMKPESKEDVGDDLMDIDASGEEDRVVREFEVYFTPSIDPKTRMFVLQYPVRPHWRPYEIDERCKEVRMNPETNEMEIDLSIDADRVNFDSHAEEIFQIKYQTLATSWKPPPTSGCVVCVLSENKVYWIPIHAVVHLRPTMHYLDSKSVQSKRKPAARTNGDTAPKETKPSTSKKQIKTAELPKENEVEWVPLEYSILESVLSKRYLQKIKEQERKEINFSMNLCDYLKSFCPVSSNRSFRAKSPPTRSLLALPLKERFRTWFYQETQLHRFDTLKHLAPDESDEDILGVLQEEALLVQGLWVPKSELVCGVENKQLQKYRDCLLFLFSRDLCIKQLPKKKGNEQDKKAMEGVINALCRERPICKDWKLKESPDLNFVKLNPSVVKKQEQGFKNLEKTITSFLSEKTK